MWSRQRRNNMVATGPVLAVSPKYGTDEDDDMNYV